MNYNIVGHIEVDLGIDEYLIELRNRDIAFNIHCIYELEKAQKGMYASTAVVHYVSLTSAAHDWYSINTFMRDLDVTKLSAWTMMSVLRSTFFCKERLPGYNTFLARSQGQLKDHPNFRKLFYGLTPNSENVLITKELKQNEQAQISKNVSPTV